jgi:hypothetical protein
MVIEYYKRWVANCHTGFVVRSDCFQCEVFTTIKSSELRANSNRTNEV